MRNLLISVMSGKGAMKRNAAIFACLSFGVLSLCVPRGMGASQQPPDSQQQEASTSRLPDYSVVSIKQNPTAGQGRAFYTDDGFILQNAPLVVAIRMAYSRLAASDEEFSGIPDWARTDRFDIEAKVDPSDAASYQKLARPEKALMVQKLLAERFMLKVHDEPRERSGYDLVVAKGGPKVKPSEPGPGITRLNSHEMNAQGYTIPNLAVPLTQIVGRTVEDKTGLQGYYDFALNWAPQSTNETGDAGPSIFTALEDQLGLKLVPTKLQVNVLVIDHVEKPTSN